MSPNPHVFDHQVFKADKGQAPQASGWNNVSMDQNHTNSKILARLIALGARLDNMESSMKTVKKTNDSSKIKKSRVKTKATVAHNGLKRLVWLLLLFKQSITFPYPVG